jgi:SSS family solute:Na+ symporter
VKDFNLWFVLMYVFLNAYGTMAWQNQSAFNSAPLTAHESRMGSILGRWREMGKAGVVALLGICALTYLHHPHYAAQAALVHQDLSQISDPQTREQMEIPMALSHLLPAGLKGSLCIIFLMGVFCGDGQHLHSWGSLFIQDVIVPLRKTPLTPQQHIRWLRLSMTGVALFAFLFGCFFRQIEYIQMWWIITTAIYVGGAGAAIIGGLYWKKGTSAGAWVALITGSVLSGGGILVREYWENYGHSFPLNPIQISFIATLTAIFLYIFISLLTNKEDFNMDRMLHRGKYAKIVQQMGEVTIEPARKKAHWAKLVGFDNDFSLGDKWIAGVFTGWNLVFFVLFIVITVWNLIAPWQTQSWATYWEITAIGIPIFLAVVMAIWFTWGGVRDIRALFQRLEEQRVNALDNGMVVNHQNLDESALTQGSLPTTPRSKTSSDIEERRR